MARKVHGIREALVLIAPVAVACASSSRTERELSEIRKELAELKQLVQSRGQCPQPEAAPAGTASHDAGDAGFDESTLSPWERHYRKNPGYEGFESEPIDPEWAPSTEAALNEAVKRHKAECQCESVKVECRSTACWFDITVRVKMGPKVQRVREGMQSYRKLRVWAGTIRSDANFGGGGWSTDRPVAAQDANNRPHIRIGMPRPLTPADKERLRLIWKDEP